MWSSRANSTIRIAFLQARPMSTRNPIWVKMLLSPLVSHTPVMAQRRRHRHDQDDRERQRPALVLRREHQEREQHAEREDEDRGVARQPLLVAEVGPLVADAVRQHLAARCRSMAASAWPEL